MEFLTIHELSRLSGVSTATIRLDIKSGKLSVASPGRKGRGNPTRIKVTDLERSDRILYQQLAKQFIQHGAAALEAYEHDSGKMSVNELALRTGLSPQVVRKDIVDGKLKAGGGGRRGSPYYVLYEDLADARRVEYKRLVETQRGVKEDPWQSLQSEILHLKKDVEFIKDRLNGLINYLDGTSNDPFFSTDSSESSFTNGRWPVLSPHTSVVEIQLNQIKLPRIYNGYFVSEDKLKQLKNQLQLHRTFEPVNVRLTDDGMYLLRKGIAQYHLAQELEMSSLPAIVEEAEKQSTK